MDLLWCHTPPAEKTPLHRSPLLLPTDQRQEIVEHSVEYEDAAAHVDQEAHRPGRPVARPQWHLLPGEIVSDQRPEQTRKSDLPDQSAGMHTILPSSWSPGLSPCLRRLLL